MSNLPPLSKTAQDFKLGTYRHYKGHEYTVMGVGRYEETLAELVFYKATDGSGNMWARPLADFLAIVESNSYNGPRFTYIK